VKSFGFCIPLLIIGLMIVVISAPFVNAQQQGEYQAPLRVLAGGSCVIVGSVRAPAIIIVYEENNQGSNGRELLSEQWLQKDEKKNFITSATGRIRFVYKFKSSDPWSDSVGTSCTNNSEVCFP